MKKMFVGVTCALMLASLGHAQTTDVKKNTHQNYDQRARDCKKQASDQNLSGDEGRAFVARCMKANA